jgi:energy-coupling factor transport system permease protein
MFVELRLHPERLIPASPTDLPGVPVLACLGILVAALPAFLSPPLPDPEAERVPYPKPDREGVAA